jgi:predicted ester cyclase
LRSAIRGPFSWTRNLRRSQDVKNCGKNMENQANDTKALIRRIYEEMWNQANPAAAREIFAHPEGVEKYVTGFLASFSGLQHIVEGIFLEGDLAAARFSARGTQRGDLEEYFSTGREIHYTGVTWMRIADGKIQEHYTWWDRWEVEKQLRDG